MPRKPSVSTLNTNSVGILNTIRDNASPEYRAAVPYAEQTTESIRYVGDQILNYAPRTNEFINALINRIGMVLVSSKMYSNRFSMFKRGMLELGESIEEIFVQLAKPFQYGKDTETAPFRKQIPNVKSMFHAINYTKFYKQTINRDLLSQAFLSWDGVTDMITRIVNSMYSAMAYDEYLMVKYMIATLALKGVLHTEAISDPTVEANANTVLSTLKTVSNNMEFMRTDYNIAGVENFTLKEDQYLFQTAAFSANIDVNALAKAFNLEYAKFLGHQMMVDTFSFSAYEQERIGELLADDPDFSSEVIFSADNLAVLDGIQAVLVDKDFFMLFDKLQEATDIFNPEGLYWNYYLHTWKIFSASPFANAVVFTSGDAATITSVTVSQLSGGEYITKGGSYRYGAAVVGTGMYSRGVKWTISGNDDEKTKIDENGVLVCGANEGTLTSDTITITATSVEDGTVYGTTTISGAEIPPSPGKAK